MTLIKYRIFQAVTETMSFTTASKQLSMSQSAVSHSIGNLEQELGFPLFKRIKNKIVLTNEGELILNKITQLLSYETEVLKEVNAINNLELGKIRIGSFTSASNKFLPPVIKSFEELYPNISLEIYEGSYSELSNLLAQGKIDIAFLPEEYLSNSLYSVPIYKDKMLALFPKNITAELPSKVHPKILENFSFIMPQNSCNKSIYNIFENYEINPNIKYNIQLNSTIFSMIEYGLGISVVPESVLLKTKYNIIAKQFSTPIFRTIYLSSNSLDIKSKNIQNFFDVVLDTVKCNSNFK